MGKKNKRHTKVDEIEDAVLLEIDDEGEVEGHASSSKADNFIRLGNDRLGQVMAAVTKLEKLSNKALYEFDDDQITVIIETLRFRIDELELSFINGGPSKGGKWL